MTLVIEIAVLSLIIGGIAFTFSGAHEVRSRPARIRIAVLIGITLTLVLELFNYGLNRH